MSDLPTIFGHDPLQLLAEEASPKMIHDWIDTLYNSEFEPGDRRFVCQLYTVAALGEHIQTYPLNPEYQEKFNRIAELVHTLGTEFVSELEAQ